MRKVFENRPQGSTTPPHWRSIPLKYLFRRSKSLGSGQEQLLSIYRDYGVIPKDSRDDNFNKASDDLSKYQLVSQGDLVVNKMKAWQGSVAVSEYDGIISPAYFVYRPVGEIDNRFAHYLLRSSEYFQYYASISSGVRPNQWDLNPHAFERLEVSFPPLKEQKLIAEYLDRETAEIDAFIADLDDYSTLLSHRLDAERDRIFLALLDSSNPVPLKRWLKIPLSYGATAAANHFDPGEVRYLRITDFGAEGDLRPEVATSLPYEAAAGYMTAPGDILLARSGATVGKAFMVPDSLPEACFAGYLVRARCQNRVEASFVWHALQTTKYKDWIAANATVATIQNVSAQKFGTYRIPRPSLAKQSEVIEELDRVQKNIDASQALSAEARTLAVERRAALISAAVTGQIDVTAQGVSAAEQLRDDLEAHL